MTTGTDFYVYAQTKEQLSFNGKKGASALSFEQRSRMSRQRAKTLGPERLREISLKAVAGRLAKRKKRLLQDDPLISKRIVITDAD
jgi:hypothetical protein